MPTDFDAATWHAARAKVVGASEVSALFGAQPPYAMSHYTLWMVKSGRIAPPDVPGERPKWGLRLEEIIGAAVAEEHGWLVERPILRHITHPRVAGMGCTLDFVAKKNGVNGVIETKNSDWLIHKRQWGDEPPTHVLLQLQHQLSCCDAEWGAVACLVGGNHLEVYEYDRNAKIVAEIERRVAVFWQSIRDGKVPPVDGSDSTAGTLHTLFPEDDGIEVPADLTADNILPELCGQYIDALTREKVADEDRTKARNAILAKLGEHREAWCQGYLIKAPAIPYNPGTLITEAMVGTFIGARKGSRRLSLKETQQ